jgi:hypothetical protein
MLKQDNRVAAIIRFVSTRKAEVFPQQLVYFLVRSVRS